MRFALFGAGRAGTIHARNIADHPRAELGYVYDVDQAAAQRLTTACGGITPRNPQQIWQADDVDAVLIASSTDTHVDLLRQAMRAGKPTYCEKPIDLDIEKVRMFVDEASACDPPLFIGFRRRFQPEFQSMHRQIRDGAIGQIESIRITARDFELASLAFLQRSGGLLRDKMIHYFDPGPMARRGEANRTVRKPVPASSTPPSGRWATSTPRWRSCASPAARSVR